MQPIVNAMIADRFDSALREAREYDKILDSGNISDEYSEENAPLLGLPFTSKEAFAIEGKYFDDLLYIQYYDRCIQV